MSKRPISSSMLPDTIAVLPLSGALLLPHTHRPLNIFEPRYIALVDHALGHDRLIGLIQPESAREESPAGSVPLRRIGCIGRISQFDESEDDHYLVVLEGISRFEIDSEIETDAPFRQCRIATARFANDFDPDAGEEAVDRQRFLGMMRDYADFAQLDIDWNEIDETGTADLVNFACMMSPYGAAEKQVLLEARTLEGRAETLMAIAELEMARSRSGTVVQ